MAFALVSGCVAERSFPAPAQMCENLVSVCGRPSIAEFNGVEECFRIGRAGVANARDEDQCFAVHDECISDCKYYAYWMSFYDAGTEASAPDGAAAPLAEAGVPDAASVASPADASTAE